MTIDIQLFADGETGGAPAENDAENITAQTDKQTDDADTPSARLMNALKEDYPEAADDDALINAFLDGRNADKQKKEKEASKRDLLAKADEEARKQASERLKESWKKQEEELKELYPSFSLEEEMKKGGDFKTLLCAGAPVRLAFEAANFDRLIGSAMKYAAAEAGRKTALSIRESSARVQENSVLSRAPAVIRRDVNALSGKDIIRILDEVSRGAKISF